MKRNFLPAKQAALNGIMAALLLITLFFAAYSPTGRFSLYALSSFYVSILVIEFGAKNGWAFYVATNILALFLIPDKVGLLPYTFFFGLYGLVKYYIEKLGKLVPEYILKLMFFNICLGAGFIFIKSMLLGDINLRIPLWIVVLALEIVFIIYDYVYSLLVQYYWSKLRNKFKP
jgi:hypothetical protein